ncbi:MAG: hypothetical protein LBQ19_02300, partial [Synergistaceae bacterium]|nr:hypothetical protein [Synergistaceae bacterium]
MFFDEKKREKLIEEYYALPSFERQAFRALTAFYAPIAVTNFTFLLNALKPKDDDARPVKWDAKKNLIPALLRWHRAGLVRKVNIASYDHWVCSRLVSEPVTREAIDLGEFDRLFQVVSSAGGKLSGTVDTWHGKTYSNYAHFIKDFRRAIYLGDDETFTDLWKGGVNITRNPNLEKNMRLDIPECHPFIEILFNPADEKIMGGLPQGILSQVLEWAIPFCHKEMPEEIEHLRRILTERAASRPDDAPLTRLLALEFIGAGMIKDAEDLIVSLKSDDSQRKAFEGTIALMRGNYDEALLSFEDGLKHLRKETHRRKVAFGVWCGAFCPILMLRAGVPKKKILDYLDAAREQSISAGISHMTMRYLLDEGDDRLRIFEPSVAEKIKRAGSLYDAFFLVLFANWIDPHRTLDLLESAVDTCRKMTAAGMTYFASELADIVRELSPARANELGSLPAPAFPLKNLIRHKSDWELSLEALSGIVEKDAQAKNRDKDGAKRLIWRIDWHADKDKKVRGISIRAFEQVMRTRGWSVGKEVPMRRLYEHPETVECLTEQDRTAISAIYEDRGWRGVHVYIDPTKMLSGLSGHPFLFKGDSDKKVEITSDEPKFSALASGNGCVLKMEPYPNEYELLHGFIALEESQDRIKVVAFGEKHLNIARILGPSGLKTPNAARESVLKLLGGLASVVTVQSDIAGEETGAESVPPDTRLSVLLQPSGDGLDIEIVVRPLGEGSAPCRPGVGGQNIFGLLDGNKVQTRRDMKGETAALKSFTGSCRALSDAEQVSLNRWRMDDAELSLEFLLQLGDVADRVVIEWPKGGGRSVTRVHPSSMSLSVRSSRDWFAVSGEIKVDSDLVWGMKEIVKLVGASGDRFINIGKDRFIAITEEFRRRVEDLSSLGDLKGDELIVAPISTALLSQLAGDVGKFEGDGKWKAGIDLIDEASSLAPAMPATFRGELRVYQFDGYCWLRRLAHWGAGACLADDMGLGKTIQALALLLSRAPDGPSLVVAPTSVCSNWIEEGSRFTPSLRFKELRAGENGDRASLVNSLDSMDVLVASYGLLERETQLLCGLQWRTIILDEAQAIKNMDTKRSAAAMKLGGDFRVVTTGTPIENNLSELWNLFRFINPHYLGSLESFNSRFAIPIEREGNKNARKRLKRIISPFVLRRTKEQVLTELPPKTEITLRVDMKEEERAVYEAVRRNAIEAMESTDQQAQRFVIFAQLIKLRRACCNSSLVLKDADYPRPSAKLDAFSEIMEDLLAGSHKALVFSQFVDHLSIIRGRLDEMGV